MFEALYEVRDDDREPFGDKWIGPEKFAHFDDHLIAIYTSDEGSDGQSVQVYASAAPARFWSIVAMEDRSSVGTVLPGYRVGTGSGGREMAEYVAKTAEMIATGMLGFHPGNHCGEDKEGNA